MNKENQMVHKKHFHGKEHLPPHAAPSRYPPSLPTQGNLYQSFVQVLLVVSNVAEPLLLYQT